MKKEIKTGLLKSVELIPQLIMFGLAFYLYLNWLSPSCQVTEMYDGKIKIDILTN